MDAEPGEEVLQDLYAWIDQIPLSRPKRSVARDFSDGGEGWDVIQGRVDKPGHGEPRASVFWFGSSQFSDLVTCKPEWVGALLDWDWRHLIKGDLSDSLVWGFAGAGIDCLRCCIFRKVFSKLNFHVPEETVKKIVLSTAGVIEPVLCTLRNKINEKRLGKSMNEKSRTLPQDLEYYSISNEQSQAAFTSVMCAPIPVQEASRFLYFCASLTFFLFCQKYFVMLWNSCGFTHLKRQCPPTSYKVVFKVLCNQGPLHCSFSVSMCVLFSLLTCRSGQIKFYPVIPYAAREKAVFPQEGRGRYSRYVQVPKVYSYTNEASEQRRLDWTCSQTDRPKQKPSSHVDPAFLLLMEEKEQALLALQETMEILQMKVNRLEHLVHLKDLRIDDLTRQLERYKSRAHMK
nr:PREDICTED: sperm flagellar protein 1-like [Lepisosteus oculatus]